MLLSKNELLMVRGGGSGIAWIIAAAASFLIGIVDGIFNPVACNKWN